MKNASSISKIERGGFISWELVVLGYLHSPSSLSKQVSSFFFFFFLGGQNTDLIFCLIAEKVVEKEEILSKIKKSFMFRSLFASFVKNTKRAGLDC